MMKGKDAKAALAAQTLVMAAPVEKELKQRNTHTTLTRRVRGQRSRNNKKQDANKKKK